MTPPQRLTQHIHCGLTPLPFACLCVTARRQGTLLPSVATSYMLGTLTEIAILRYGGRASRIGAGGNSDDFTRDYG